MPRLRWEQLACDEDRVASLAQDLRVSPVVARLLCLRGHDEASAAARFLDPRLEHLHDPFRLADMPVAVDRLLAAIERGELIGIHGDFDVDGVTATVILRRALDLLGARVRHFIPDRLRDGYGLQPESVDRLHADGVRVLVSVDCGIRSVAAAERARARGVDLLVTDHHEPDRTLPPALAVVNPKRHDCAYPDKNLSGAGVALKLVQGLCVRRGREGWLPGFVKMAAIGTLADVVPLHGENRIIAKVGLERLSQGPNTVGLRSLLAVAGLTGRPLDSHHVAFMLAPRVNAAGRMSSPDLATRLLLSVDESTAGDARAMAEQLDQENLKRQREESEIVAQARRAVETNPEIGAHGAIVVAGEGWHRGVIGIVASKLVELFHRPTVVLSLEDGLAYGSGRSIPAFDLLGGLERCEDLFLRFGGHRQAAGLTMEAARVSELRARLGAHADAVLEPDDLVPRLRIDATLALSGITSEVIEGLARLEPFGSGNPRPIFQAGPVTLADGPRVLKERHIKMAVRQQGRVFQAVAWRAAERAAFLEANRAGLELAYSLSESRYRGERYVELTVADAREAR